MNDLMSVAEASEMLCLKQATVRRWILEQRVTYVKLGRRVFLRRSDLNSLISDSVVPARKPEAI
jgi:excisionase family DNA binding protein